MRSCFVLVIAIAVQSGPAKAGHYRDTARDSLMVSGFSQTASVVSGLSPTASVVSGFSRTFFQRNQGGNSASTEKLPPLSYVCPMAGDEDVIEDAPGRCRKCGMQLQPIRLETAWTCPVHAAVMKDQPGKCPIDGRELVQVTAAVSWTCRGTTVDALTPGPCADGSPRVKKFTPRPHGNHNPQHGGVFFMAPDNWHHLEGTYPRAGVFRLYLYDDYTKPLPRDQVRKTTARLVVRESFDTATRTTKELVTAPLVLAPNGRYLEAKIGDVPLPAQLTAKIKFQPAAAEHRFDFAFAEYSKEPASPRITENGASPAVSRPATPVPPPASTGTAASAASPATSSLSGAPSSVTSSVDPGLIPLPIPDTVPEIIAQLQQRTEQVRRFIDQGAFASVYVPAFQAKDLALALDERKNDLNEDTRTRVEPAIKRLVRSAWLLDAFGDLGNREHIAEAFEQFATAAKDVETAFGGAKK
jgi:heavy metal-binding protein